MDELSRYPLKHPKPLSILVVSQTQCPECFSGNIFEIENAVWNHANDSTSQILWISTER